MASLYATVKLIHVSAVAATVTGFALRFWWSLQQRRPPGGWLRIAPHLVDTVLLASALSLLWLGRFDVLENPWLGAKLTGLLLYIVAGSMALKRGQTRRVRAASFALAIATFAYIVSVAVTKSPWGMLSAGA